MSAPDIGPAEMDAVKSVLMTGALSIGPRIQEFENALAAYVGARYGIGVNSGTAALHLAVIAAGVREGDYVITSPFSFVASANAILYERGVPIFVDVDPLTGNIAPELVKAAVTAIAGGTSEACPVLPPSLRGSGAPNPRRLRALLPVHCFGQPAAMNALMETARQHDLTVIEDACEAIGAEHEGRQAGTFGDAAAFAFYPNKQMTTGEGGMLVTNRREWAEVCRSLRNQGRDIFDSWLRHSRLGYNYRLDELGAALGCVQTARLDELLAKRARVAGWYTSRLNSCRPLIDPPVVAASTTRMSWFVYVIKLAPEVDRPAVMADLEADGIPSRPYFSPIHLQPFYRERFGYQPGDFPITEDLGARSLALPFSSVMTEHEVDAVVSRLRASVERRASTRHVAAGS